LPVKSFKGRYRGRVKMYYIGGIDPDSNQQGLEEYLIERGVTPIKTSVFKSKNGDLAAKINIPLYQSEFVEDTDFWPRFTRCRQWMSQYSWDKYRQVSVRNDYHDHSNTGTYNNDRDYGYNQYPLTNYTDQQQRYEVTNDVLNID
ncbi:MAG: hypothetical protein ABW185_13580, partial [Sedimenticola sp.]